MSNFFRVVDVARLWNCTERNVQLLCKEGVIKGAKKISGVWVIPKESIAEKSNEMQAVVDEANDEYKICDGIALSFQDIDLNFAFRNGSSFSKDFACTNGKNKGVETLIIRHCKEGRLEGVFPDGRRIYIGSDTPFAYLQPYTEIDFQFPLDHYFGFTLQIDPIKAISAIRDLEKVFGSLNIDLCLLQEGLSEENLVDLYYQDSMIDKICAEIYYLHFGEMESSFEAKTGFKKPLCEGKCLVPGHIKLEAIRLIQCLCAQKSCHKNLPEFFKESQVLKVKEARQYLVSHLDQRLTLQEISDCFGVSLTSLKTKFKAVYGKPVGEYMMDYRVQRAADFLINSNEPAYKIQSMLGFQNFKVFSREFTKRFGMQPLEYKKRKAQEVSR